MSVGLWRSPLQSFYVAMKFPLLILMTTACNALINGMLAQVFGTKLTFCYPSFYIFICLAGIDLKPASALLVLLSSISVFSILIVGFAPVAWVFSQSTNTVFFIGFFHIIFWFISTIFGMRVLVKAALSLRCRNLLYPLFWILIFVITSLQMMTALRPIIATSDSILPKEKVFFMYHWGKLFSETIEKTEGTKGDVRH